MGILEAVPTKLPEGRGAESPRDTSLVSLREGHVLLVPFYHPIAIPAQKGSVGKWGRVECYYMVLWGWQTLGFSLWVTKGSRCFLGGWHQVQTYLAPKGSAGLDPF